LLLVVNHASYLGGIFSCLLHTINYGLHIESALLR